MANRMDGLKSVKNTLAFSSALHLQKDKEKGSQLFYAAEMLMNFIRSYLVALSLCFL